MKKNHIFKLVEVYELLVGFDDNLKFVRVELFESTSTSCWIRARVWLNETYNMYQSELNTDGEGKNLHRLYSSDVVNRDITTILPFGKDLIEGRTYASKETFINDLLPQVESFIKEALIE